MQLWKKMKKNRKGFTLVEIIVVLVILAILAAFTIPAMLGFVKDARSKAAIAQAREVYVAAQSAATEVLAGKGETKLTDDHKASIIKKTTAQVSSDLAGFTIKDTNVIDATTLPANDSVTKPTNSNEAVLYIDGNTGKVLGLTFKSAGTNSKVLYLKGEEGTDVLE